MKTALFPAATVTVSAKGQCCIPKKIRDALGLTPGSRVELQLLPDGFSLRRLTRPDGEFTPTTRQRPRKEAARR